MLLPINLVKQNYVVNDEELKSLRAEYQSWTEYQPQHNEGTLCSICSRGILSEVHKNGCDTILMWEDKEQIIEPGKAFKPMMTFGLGGCTAALIAIKEKENFIRVMLIHDPSKEKVAIYVIQKLNLYRDRKYSSYIIIRGPGKYQKIEKKFYMISKDNDYWKGKLNIYDNIRFCIEGYNLTRMYNSLDTTLHCKLIGNELQYTNTIGKWINIELCNT